MGNSPIEDFDACYTPLQIDLSVLSEEESVSNDDTTPANPQGEAQSIITAEHPQTQSASSYTVNEAVSPQNIVENKQQHEDHLNDIANEEITALIQVTRAEIENSQLPEVMVDTSDDIISHNSQNNENKQ